MARGIEEAHPMTTATLSDLLASAIDRRADLLAELADEQTDAYRVFHGVAEGRPGLTVDRYGSVLLVQTWNEPIATDELDAIRQSTERALDTTFELVWNHRGKDASESFDQFHAIEPPRRPTAVEFGLSYDVRPRHGGQDPLLFLDLRAGRRCLLGESGERSTLNLFSYTGSLGVAAAAGGATHVWNVDHATAASSIARANAKRNRLLGRFTTIEEDVLPIVRQFAGLPVSDRRGGRKRTYEKVEKRPFDLVILDPPAWSQGPFGAVDVVRDYASLFKPALLATRKGGRMLVTNNSARVELDPWIATLQRCAEKANRPIRDVAVIDPDPDFPTFDGQPPLKIAWLVV